MKMDSTTWRCITHGGIAVSAIGCAIYFDSWIARIICGIILLINSWCIISGDW